MLAADSTGFADPVLDAQSTFRTLMDAFARPGRVQRLGARLVPPAGLAAGLAAAALALTDHETAVWLDPPLAADRSVAAYLTFHTGARLTADPKEAAFALVSDLDALPPLGSFSVGDDAYPDRSTTIVACVSALSASGALRLAGPGIDGERRLGVAPWPARLTAELAENRALFPRGVDLVLVAPEAVAALPRTTRIVEAG
ncbi:phosphonate C-P lyase system protein PhnH [Kaistia geumhonensis]|uniref:Alpha-D-ribose 1-methylphosphonate 5-triphosphate synthase subunit PhnH n=1 Tax=Kaistia geumhonensis TaxID=410839 RepID=A0ABU0M4P5_9HYPH|nr:phosphonate C-P lyase system protein PhnH [Kaistia geumhonensis]MCX5478847.1 phosphonate C-P lyase system protein PhnH [Kaistia geumhonensis]MDQ0515934.1 alpha-D-ribose 1-methylphosphonate 5-triphosphate synthase subunit PhnH [Kaistia geumhonensis]